MSIIAVFHATWFALESFGFSPDELEKTLFMASPANRIKIGCDQPSGNTSQGSCLRCVTFHQWPKDKCRQVYLSRDTSVHSNS